MGGRKAKSMIGTFILACGLVHGATSDQNATIIVNPLHLTETSLLDVEKIYQYKIETEIQENYYAVLPDQELDSIKAFAMQKQNSIQTEFTQTTGENGVTKVDVVVCEDTYLFDYNSDGQMEFWLYQSAPAGESNGYFYLYTITRDNKVIAFQEATRLRGCSIDPDYMDTGFILQYSHKTVYDTDGGVQTFLYNFDGEWQQQIYEQTALMSDGSNEMLVTVDIEGHGVSIEKNELNIQLEDGRSFSKTFFYAFEPSVYIGDLTNDGENEIVVVLRSTTSNILASEIHVLKIMEEELCEILTIMSCPTEEDYEKYPDTIFEVNEYEFGWDEGEVVLKDQARYCTDGYLVEVSEGNGRIQYGLKISHNTKWEPIYTILTYEKGEWEIFEQGIETQ